MLSLLLVSYPMIERLGRRKMFLWGTAGQALSMVSVNLRCYGEILNASFSFLACFCLIPYNVKGDTQNTATYGAVVALFLFLMAFGWYGVPQFLDWHDLLIYILAHGSNCLGCYRLR